VKQRGVGYLKREKDEKERIEEYNHAEGTCLKLFIISLRDLVVPRIRFPVPRKE
jgi:hypothetical protein